MKQPLTYTPLQKTLHWIVAIIFISMIPFGFFMASIPPSDTKWYYYMLHKSVGTILFLIILLRIFVRLELSGPPYPSTLTPLHLALTRLSVPVLYLSMVTIPLSGIIMSVAGGHGIGIFNIWTIPGMNPKAESVAAAAHWVHVNVIYAVIAIISLHICAAFYHHLVLKNNILMRMMPEVRKP